MTKRAVSEGENLWLTWNVRVIIVNMGDRVGCLAGNLSRAGCPSGYGQRLPPEVLPATWARVGGVGVSNVATGAAGGQPRGVRSPP